MKRHPRKRATARSRAAKRQPLALKNPKPHEPAPWASGYGALTPEQAEKAIRRLEALAADQTKGDERYVGCTEVPGFWTRLWRRLF